MRKIYLPFLMLLVSLSTKAQNDFFMQNASSVTIQNGGLLYVNGEVKGEGNASLSNAGTLLIKTNNTALAIDGKGELEWNSSTPINNTNGVLIFQGGGDAQVHGTGAPITVGTLDFNVARVVGSVNEAEISIDKNITTSNLKLQSGLVRVNAANEIFVNNTAVNAISDSSLAGFKWGDKSSTYIIGKLRRSVVASNLYNFPVGSDPVSGKGYNLAQINTKQGFPNSDISARFVDWGNVAGTNKPNFNFYQELLTPGCPGGNTNVQWLELDEMINDFGKWEMVSSATGSNIYDFRGYPNLAAIPNLGNYVFFKLIKAPDGTPYSTDWSTFVPASGDKCSGVNVLGNQMATIPGNVPTAFIEANNLGSFSEFGIGGGASTGLPVELVSLKAQPIDNEFIKVSWVTATEIDNAGFEILKSEDGINFTTIGWQDGAGNSSAMLIYDFDDRDVLPNKLYYYRLRQIDFDGTSELTNIVTAMITDNAIFVISEFIPNPTSNTSSFTVVTSEDRNLDLVVYNTLGQIIANNRFVAQASRTNTFEVDLSDMAGGTYFAVITAGQHSFNKKIVVSR